MTPRDVEELAEGLGYERAEPLVLRSGETVFLLVGNGAVGLPLYVRKVGDVLELSSYEESMDLFNEPNYMDE